MNNDFWQWSPGKVDLKDRHFELRYGNNPAAVARIGIGDNKNFIVEFLININDVLEIQKEIFNEVLWEIELNLINNSTPDPVEYMINHTKKCANIYSKIHWRYYPRGFKRSILLSKESTFENNSSPLKRFFSKLID